MKKRIVSLLLILCMTLTFLPTTILAAETAEPIATGSEEPQPEEQETPSTGNTIYVDATNGNDEIANVGQSWDTAYKTLATAVAAAASGDTIMLSAGEYTLYNTPSDGHTKGKDLTFVGAGKDEEIGDYQTTWYIGANPTPEGYHGEYDSDYSFDGAGTITFQDMTLQAGKKDYLGFTRPDKTIVQDCTVNGKTFYWGYTSATFKDTTFNCPDGDYALWTYSSPTMTFEGCTFNSSGKVINVYTDYSAGKYDITVNYKNCTVNNNGDSLKPVLNINDSNMGNYKYILNISGSNSVSGMDADPTTCSRLFGFAEKAVTNNTGRAEVTINGVKVWENGERAVAHDYAGFSTGSYDDGVNANDTQYTDGYKDDAFTVTWGAWYAGQDGKLHRTGTCTCNYCGYSEDINDEKDFELDVSRSKTATDLDSNYRSTVTLSLPSAKEKLASDIVFVLDTSDCVGNVMKNVSKLVTQLETAQKDTGANIKVGVVAFKGSAVSMFEDGLVGVETAEQALNELIAKVEAAGEGLTGSAAKDAMEAAVWESLKEKDKDFIYKGSNLHSGLLGAQALLEADNAVDDNRKYVITVTDGMTYYWNDDEGNVYGVYSENSYGKAQLLYYPWQDAFKIGKGYSLLGSSITDWDKYIKNVQSRIDSDKNQYVVSVRKMMEDLNCSASGVREVPLASVANYIKRDSATQSAHGIEHSVVACLDTYREMVKAGYQCYTVNSDYHDTTTFPGLFTSKLNEMAKVEGRVDFEAISGAILYAVSEGSTVVDKMGSEFDFVPGSLKLTVGGKELDAKTVGDVTYFGDDATNLSESNYRFKLEYDSGEDMFTWTINENVSNFAPVQLSYQVQLVNPKTAPGNYTVPTNEYAKLNPKDSLGNPGKELTFPIPEVSYTVKRHHTPTTVTKPALNTADHYAYVMGYPDGTVQPGGYITRAEASTIFFRLLTDETREQYWATTNAYSDIKSGDWYNNAISTLSSAGIVSGYPDGTFRPNAPITRAEMSKIIALFAKLDKTTDRFSDIAGHWAEAYIKLAAGNGWIEGYPDGTFKPQQNITRAETVTMINRVLERVPSDEDHLLSYSVMLTFPDCQPGQWFYIAIQEATNSHTYERAVTEKNGDEQWTALRDNRDWTLLEK